MLPSCEAACGDTREATLNTVGTPASRMAELICSIHLSLSIENYTIAHLKIHDVVRLEIVDNHFRKVLSGRDVFAWNSLHRTGRAALSLMVRGL